MYVIICTLHTLSLHIDHSKQQIKYHEKWQNGNHLWMDLAIKIKHDHKLTKCNSTE